MFGVNHLIGFGVGGAGCGCTPAAVTGDRTASITASFSAGWPATDGGASNLVDGATGNNNSDSIDPTPSDTVGDGEYIDFTYAAPMLVNEITFRALGAFDMGDWKIVLGGETSNTFSLDGTTSVTRAVTGLTAGGTVVRLQKVGTESTTNTWWHEVEFKQCVC